ncbi:protein POLLEN DEFECTIVE IN GUIDANCE 1-like [Phragmites australis]|uniref:protein POLLEN DEFECTIVE IN GUIDANCE 1-like n=1 Tax=Phragmites australis TaxID=29695 RepID=UPI002D7927C4|nr:protein POLLEN DEFECTIVE IN GUIDANCE 1-like [Phragmites australis]
MSLRSGGRQLSFGLLAGDLSADDADDLSPRSLPDTTTDGQRRRRRRSKLKRGFRGPPIEEVAAEGEPREGGVDADAAFRVTDLRSAVETVCESSDADRSAASCVTYVGLELRQRSVSGSGRLLAASAEDGTSSCGSSTRETAAAAAAVADAAAAAWRPEANGGVKKKLEKEESLDWEKFMKDNSNILGEVEHLDNSPFRYFLGELYGGNSLRSTIAVGNEKKRQRVYNTMFHVPWRCERLILTGFFVCLDSFLSLLTIMPARIVITVWRVLKMRQFLRPNAADLSDYGCFVVLALGVASLQMIDISLIYHVIRGQGTIKLYVVYNVLEIFDKLCQSFGEDVLQVLFNSAEGLSTCSTDNVTFELMRFLLDEVIAVVAFVVHSFVLLAQAITLSTCIIAHNNALFALLVSNNFAEIKSNVFKRVSKENLHNLVYYDIIERFHITAFLLFVLAQNILEAEGPWFDSFLINASLVFFCEVLIDAIKHSFLAKFNEIKPVAYSEFLEDLCKQILNDKPDDREKDLTFIPLAPACVVIRVLTPVYATLLPAGPFIWRIFWILLWSVLTYFMLAVFKILVGLILRCLANWYVNLRLKRKQHVD